MRILVVTTELPYPPSWGGAIRNFNFLEHLSQTHEVSLLTFDLPSGEEGAAGLRRLELSPEGEEPIAIPVCVPAPGQGAVAVQAREGDPAAANLRWLNHIATSLAVQAERDMAASLGAGCSVPLGAHVEFRAAETRLAAAFHDGERLYRAEARSPAIDAIQAVQLAIADLRDQGAKWGVAR